MVSYTVNDVDAQTGVVTLTCDADGSEQTVHNVPVDNLAATVSFLDEYCTSYVSSLVPVTSPVDAIIGVPQSLDIALPE